MSSLERWGKRALLTSVACAATVVLAAAPSWAQAATVVVDDDGMGTAQNCDATTPAQTTIQGAIDAAADGDTILVCAGTYAERPVVNKSLTINGAQAGTDARTGRTNAAESVVGNGDSNNVIFAITADDVTLDGFTVQPTGTTSTDVVGIQPSGDNYIVRNNIVTGNTIGMYPGGTGGLIENNRVIDNNRAGGAGRSGIYTDSLTTNLVINENLFENHGNVSMNFASTEATGHTGLQITDNTVNGNRILLTKTTDSTISGNTITNSSFSGIQVDFNNQGLDITNNDITGSGASANGTFPAIRLTSVNDTSAPASDDISITGNNLLDNEIGVQIQNDNKTPDNGIEANFNRIFDNDTGVQNNSAFDVNAINNWWGCNEGPNSAAENDCDTVADTGAGVTDFNPWLIMDITANPQTVAPGGTSDITVSFDQNSDGQDVADDFPNGVSVGFMATGGNVNPMEDATQAALAETVFTADSEDADATVTGSLDAEKVTVNILVTSQNVQNCTIVGTNGDDVLTGTNGDDVICGLDGDDQISGLEGNDTILAGEGNDTVNGGDGNDTINGAAGDDMLFGNAGNDRIFAGEGDDRADGGEGSDTISGLAGEDDLRGQDGNDTISGGEDDDIIIGGTGQDTLRGDDGNDEVRGDGANDSISGGNGNDLLRGGTGTDTITGGAGNDTLLSNTGRGDNLSGGAGNDFLNVKDGDNNDTANGGAGRDSCGRDAGDTVRNCETNSRTAAMQRD